MASKQMFPNIFVTVGSTQFNELIEALLDPSVGEALHSVGCKKLTVQYGDYKNIDNLNLFQMMDFETELFSFRNSIQDCIDNADLVIGHAGAGTSLEVLRKGKPFLIVANENLMDNHQEELAAELADNNYAHLASVATLPAKLREFQETKFAQLQPFPEQNEGLFVNFIQNIYKTKIMKEN